MKCKKRTAALLLALWMLCAFSAAVYANEAPDESKKGAVTVEMKYDGRAVTGGTLKAYRVGQLREKDGSYSFAKTAAMEAFSGSYDDLSSAELAEKAAAFVEKNKLGAYATAENKKGKASFEKLELGLYLIVQTKASDGYEPLKPFLVSVPMLEDGRYVYEVNAAGKFELHKVSKPGKPQSPQTPQGPKLPQTGQLNWPVPVLAVLGLMLFSAGWLLRFGKKKDGYEK